MSDTSPGAGWWVASDGKWYPPEEAQDYVPPAPPPPTAVTPPPPLPPVGTTSQMPPPPTGSTPAVPPPFAGTASPPAVGTPYVPVDAEQPTSGRPKWLIPVLACGALFILVLIFGAIAGGSKKKDTTALADAPATVTAAPTTEAPTTAAPTTAAPTTEAPTTEAPTTTTAPPAPAETLSQSNARDSAQSYLAFKAFSRAGLIKQLSSSYGDGYSVADATYGVDSLNADWNEQAAKAAQEYLGLQSFSRAGLIQQLESSYGDGFTHAQAVYGVTAAGL